MKITVVGMGYVGLSISVLLSRKHDVTILEIDNRKVNLLNKKLSPINDKLIKGALKNEKLCLSATDNKESAYLDSDCIIIAVPTNFNIKKHHLDTSIVEEVLSKIFCMNDNAIIIIKSTVPIGFTQKYNEQYSTQRIIFSPEFLREGRALDDNQNPSRLILGGDYEFSKRASELFLEASYNSKVPVLFTSSSDAEAIKLFSNSYLALRVSFINEIDTFSEKKGLNSKNVIKGISLDPRMGNYYNNPSFGYGGYCLPKDTEEISSECQDIKMYSPLIQHISESNKIRKIQIVKNIMKKEPKVVEIYRINMKYKSDNFRFSALEFIIKSLIKDGAKVVIYEPLLSTNVNIWGADIINNLALFKDKSSLIVANRNSIDLDDVLSKVYSRDLFERD